MRLFGIRLLPGNQAKFGRGQFLTVSLLLGSLLLLTAYPAETAEAQITPQPRLELATTSGPTGMLLTVRGYNLKNPLCNLAYLYVRENNFNTLASLPIGMAGIRKDGTFIWQGPLPRAGIRLYAPNENSYTVPTGRVTIYFGLLQGPCVSAQADFIVTDNTNGPFVTDSDFGYNAVYNVWNRTDSLISNNSVSRSWLWGPLDLGQGVVSIMEAYQEAPNGWRSVTYFDKSRMEVTNPNVFNRTDPYYVTNGLLARELITGQLQLGNNLFEKRDGANIGVAGDVDDMFGPTYAALNKVISNPAPNETGIPIAASIDRSGNVRLDIGDYGRKWQVRAAYYEPAVKHNIAGPFWSFLNQSGKVLDSQSKAVTGRLFDPVYYATGLPITEAYWAQVKVGGVAKDVLIQAFERRVLTFTPTNSPAFQVEMGNVGQHYYNWRYGIPK